MTERSFALQRFYFGVFEPGQKPTILARTADLTGDQVAEVLQIGRIEPPTSQETSSAMPTAVGLFRGQTAHHVLAVVRINEAGMPQILYLLIDPAPMSWLGGNLQPFRGLAHAEMPTFERPRGLTPLNLDDPHPADETMQTDAIQVLLLACQDNMKVVEGLLTALIEGKNISIVNAPANLDQRLDFVGGLIAMLPLPARTIATFATNVNRPETSTAQIRFLASGVAVNDDGVVYNWETGALTPAKFDRHDYARFVTSQLRLDASLVVAHTTELSRTASWRAIRRDNLSRALHWVSRRAKVDSAVKAGQPADRQTVSSILREDPTLTDDLRVAYTRHLLSMTLAVEEWESADLIPGIAAGQEVVAKSIVEYLQEHSAGKDAIDVYRLIEHWVLNVETARSLPWQQLLHTAALAHLEYLLTERDLKSMVVFVYRLIGASAELKTKEIAPRVAAFLLPGAHQAGPLAQAYLILVAQFMEAGAFQTAINDAALVKHLPERLQKAISHLQLEENPLKPLSSTLARASETVPSAYRVVLLLRFIETALFLHRYWLIGEREIKVVSQLGKAGLLAEYEHIVRHVADEYSQPERLQTLSPPAVEVLPQIYFSVGEIDAGIRLLEYLQNNVFTVEKLTMVNDVISNIFLKLELPAEKMLHVLSGFDGSKLRPEPRIRAYFAAMVNQEWTDKLDIVAQQITTMLQSDPRLMHLLGGENGIRLMRFHADHQDARQGLRLAAAMINYAVQIGEKGPPMLANAWKLLGWSDDVRRQALDLLRQYIRMIDPDRSRNLPAFFARALGDDVEDLLNATRLMRIVTGGRNLLQFSEMLRFTHRMLLDLAITYHEGKELPPNFRIVNDLRSMTGNVSEEERQVMAANLFEIAQMIVRLGEQPSRQSNRTESRTMPLSFRSVLKEAREVAPTTPTEFMSWFGLNFSDTFVTELGLERKEAAHIFGNRSIAGLYQETLQIYQLLYRLSVAFPEENPPAFELTALKQEIDSLWEQVPYQHQQRLLPIFATATQQIGLLLGYIAGKASNRALGDRGIGKQLEEGKRQPHNEIEALRFISGYFVRKHAR